MGHDGSKQMWSIPKYWYFEMCLVWYCLLNRGDFMVKTIPTYTKYVFCAKPGVKQFHTGRASVCILGFTVWRPFFLERKLLDYLSFY